MFKYLVLLLAICFTSPAIGQDYRKYSELDRHRIDDTYSVGTYFVLVSAPWCEPCRTLKSNLKQFPNTTIYTVDLDSQPVLASRIMGGEKGIPFFVKYVVTPQGTTQTRYSNTNLSVFVSEPVAPKVVERKEDVKEPVPVEGIFDRISERINKLELDIDSKMQQLTKDRESISQKISNILDNNSKYNKSLESRFEALSAFNLGIRDTLKNILDKVSNFTFNDKPIFEKFEAAAKERKYIFESIKDLGKDRVTLLDEIRSFRADRVSILSQLNEVKEERKGVLIQLKESRDERLGLFERLAEASKERSGLLDKIASQERKFKPLQNLIDRANVIFTKLTSSIWIIIGLIVSALIGLVIILAIVSGILAVFKKLVTYILIKTGFKALVV